ncbi:hypothetical protein [Labrys neptuniae]
MSDEIVTLQVQVETLTALFGAITEELENDDHGAKERIALAAASTIRRKMGDEMMQSRRDLCLMLIARSLDLPFGTLSN